MSDPPNHSYPVSPGPPEPWPPPHWSHYLGMLVASLVPFAAVAVMLGAIVDVGQQGFTLDNFLDDGAIFLCLILASQLYVALVAVIALRKNGAWWRHPDPATLPEANRWRRRFWRTLFFGIGASVLIGGALIAWLIATCYGCIIY